MPCGPMLQTVCMRRDCTDHLFLMLWSFVLSWSALCLCRRQPPHYHVGPPPCVCSLIHTAIPIPDFVGDPTDSALPRVIELLELLKNVPDVRPVLQRNFGLEVTPRRPPTFPHAYPTEWIV